MLGATFRALAEARHACLLLWTARHQPCRGGATASIPLGLPQRSCAPCRGWTGDCRPQFSASGRVPGTRLANTRFWRGGQTASADGDATRLCVRMVWKQSVAAMGPPLRHFSYLYPVDAALTRRPHTCSTAISSWQRKTSLGRPAPRQQNVRLRSHCLFAD